MISVSSIMNRTLISFKIRNQAGISEMQKHFSEIDLKLTIRLQVLNAIFLLIRESLHVISVKLLFLRLLNRVLSVIICNICKIMVDLGKISLNSILFRFYYGQ